MRITLALVLLSLFAFDARGFEYEEHKYLSNVGLRIALLYHGSDHAACESLDAAFLAGIEENSSYGDIAALGDYIHDVEEIFTRIGMLTPDSGYDAKTQERVATLRRNFLRFLQASHVNEQHFQLAALLTHMTHHDAALLMARDGRLQRALILEAYGLHFLEDFHAPGHVATTRPLLPDYVAIGVHEKYNAQGLRFAMKSGEPSEGSLQDILTNVLQNFDGLQLHELAQKKLPGKLRFQRVDFAELQGSLDAPAFRFHGDGSLANHEVQAAYLALLAARSILDVLEAGCPNRDAPAAANRFRPICWYLGNPAGDTQCGGAGIPDKGLLRSVGTPFGTYDAAEEKLLGFWFKPGDVLFVSWYNEFAAGGGTDGRAGRSELALETLLVSGVPLAYLDAGKNVPREFAAAKRASFFVPTLLYGVSRTFGSNDTSGAHVRLLVALPWIDIQASVAYGVRFYELRTGGKLRRYPLTYGLETGFGFLLLHLGINEETFSTQLGGTRTARYARAGVTFVLPKSVYRIPFRWAAGKLSRTKH